MGQANSQLGVTQGAIGQTQGAINTAEGLNTGGSVANSLALLQAQANGTAPSAAQSVLQSGKNQAISQQQAMANSGNVSQMISGQKTALDNAANLTQQAANQATQLQATQQQVGQQNFANAAAQQATTANTAASLQQAQAAQQANIYGTQLGSASNLAGATNTALGTAQSGQANALGIAQGVQTQTSQNQAQMLGGALNAGGASAAALSDANLKTNITPIDPTATRETAGEGTNSGKFWGPNGEDLRPHYQHEDDAPKTVDPRLVGIKNSYSSGSDVASGTTDTQPDEGISDKNAKKDIKSDKKDMVDAFLDHITPVSFDYKNPDGQMGKTPGKHMGVIAQQVEKAPGGKSMIVETPQGKGIDLATAVGTLMAAAAHQHEKIKDLEDLFKSRKTKK